MLIRDICEDRNEQNDMIHRAWNRSVMSGRLHQVPRLFSKCVFSPSQLRQRVTVDLIINPRIINLEFQVYATTVDINRYFIFTNAYIPADRVQDAINHVLGTKLTDVQLHDFNPDGHHPAYSSAQLQSWITEQVKPWMFFIAYPDAHYDWKYRLNWLRTHAGKKISNQDHTMLILNPLR